MTDISYRRTGKGQIKRFAKLQMKKYRDREGLFLAEGLRTVTELLDHMPDESFLTALFVEPGQLQNIPHRKYLREKIFLIDPDEGHRLSGTSTSQGVVGIFRQQSEAAFFYGREKSLVIALDDVQDPGNTGTIVRTAAWFGVSAMVCGPGTADRYNPKAIRAGAGSIYCVNHYGVDNLQQELEKMRKRGFAIFCSSLRGEDFRLRDAWPDRIVLVIGNEANGVSKELTGMADRLVAIPRGKGKEGVESLNAAVSAAILIAHLSLGY